jgi:hypothetical protein
MSTEFYRSMRFALPISLILWALCVLVMLRAFS